MVCASAPSPGIRQLQLMLLKVSLILGVEIHVNVEFLKLVEPPEEQTDDSELLLSYSRLLWNSLFLSATRLLKELI